MGSCGRLGESPNTWKHFGPDPTQAQYSVNSVLVRETVTWGGWTWAAMDSGSRITGGGSGYVAHFAHAGGVLYGTELGSVTFKRVGLFRFPIKHSTHTLCAASHCADSRYLAYSPPLSVNEGSLNLPEKNPLNTLSTPPKPSLRGVLSLKP